MTNNGTDDENYFVSKLTRCQTVDTIFNIIVLDKAMGGVNCYIPYFNV